ncbi:MAG TPA: hypothetical protein VGC78_00970 [Gaiellaceae bacterium]|jgi:hypothetical protein
MTATMGVAVQKVEGVEGWQHVAGLPIDDVALLGRMCTDGQLAAVRRDCETALLHPGSGREVRVLLSECAPLADALRNWGSMLTPGLAALETALRDI